MVGCSMKKCEDNIGKWEEATDAEVGGERKSAALSGQSFQGDILPLVVDPKPQLRCQSRESSWRQSKTYMVFPGSGGTENACSA